MWQRIVMRQPGVLCREIRAPSAAGLASNRAPIVWFRLKPGSDLGDRMAGYREG
jgi:hypothetical protein